MYLYQHPGWPAFIWREQRFMTLLGEVRHLQGKLIGKMEAMGFQLREEASLETITLEILNSNEIEGDLLDQQQVRSSVARRLGMEIAGLVPSDRPVDGVVEMVLDAIQQHEDPLTEERLFGWHAALFPGGRSGMTRIQVGTWRNDATGPMQVVSGPLGKEQVHFQAPAAETLDQEMQQFLLWFNHENSLDPVLKAAVAHLWFITIHPFEDGNGRIARALTDMLLARADGLSQRFYSMSAQISKERSEYYNVLERSQKGTLDISDWLEWFLRCLLNALTNAEDILSGVMARHTFWARHQSTQLNERQISMLNRLLEGFVGKLTSGKWANITKCSQDTAIRDIQDLVAKNILEKGPEGGRSTSYVLVEGEGP